MRLALARALFARLVSRPWYCGLILLVVCAARCKGAAWGSSQPRLWGWGVLEALQLCVCDETLCTDPVLFLLLIPMSCFPQARSPSAGW